MADDDYTASLHAMRDIWEKLTEAHSALMDELPREGTLNWDRPFGQSEEHGARIEEILRAQMEQTEAYATALARFSEEVGRFRGNVSISVGEPETLEEDFFASI